MTATVSDFESVAQISEIAHRVKDTGGAGDRRKQGQPFVAVVSLEDLSMLQRIRKEQRVAALSQAMARAALEDLEPEPTDEEIVEVVHHIRKGFYREHYGEPQGPSARRTRP